MEKFLAALFPTVSSLISVGVMAPARQLYSRMQPLSIGHLSVVMDNRSSSPHSIPAKGSASGGLTVMVEISNSSRTDFKTPVLCVRPTVSLCFIAHSPEDKPQC